MTRCVQQSFLFEAEADREWIYQKIITISELYFVDLYSVTVMSNHYHLVLAMGKPDYDGDETEKRFVLSQENLE